MISMVPFRAPFRALPVLNRLPRAAAGMMARPKPSLAASFNRASARATARTSPDRPISPKTTVSGGTGTPLTDDTRAAATARSAAGSPIFSPPATFRYTSRLPSARPHRASSTAMIIASRPESQPRTARLGVPRDEVAVSD